MSFVPQLDIYIYNLSPNQVIHASLNTERKNHSIKKTANKITLKYSNRYFIF